MARRYSRKTRSRSRYSPARGRGRRVRYGRTARSYGRRGTRRRGSGNRTVRIVIEQPGTPSLSRVVPGLIGGTMVNSGGAPKSSKF